jgi:AcrR family transcriptional regulator
VVPDRSGSRRLLDAAEAEFAAHGLAGAHLPRIAAAAGASPRDVEAHYGSKEQLFDTVVAAAGTRLADDVPLRPDDLPGFAGAILDYVVAHPTLLRLAAWRALERPQHAAADREAYRRRVLALRAAREDGRLPAVFEPVDLLAIVLAVATAWPGVSPALASLAADEPASAERLAAHRAAVVDPVRRMLAPAPAPAPAPVTFAPAP